MRILVLPGDGVGPEIVAESIKVLKAADEAFGLSLSFDYEGIRFTSLQKYGTTLRRRGPGEGEGHMTVLFSVHNLMPTTRHLRRAGATYLRRSA